MVRTIAALTAAGCVFFSLSAALAQSDGREHEIGGPLAGLRLPPFPTQHGEQPGYPAFVGDRLGRRLRGAIPGRRGRSAPERLASPAADTEGIATRQCDPDHPDGARSDSRTVPE